MTGSAFCSFLHSRSSFLIYLLFLFQFIICVILDSNLSDFLFSVYFVYLLCTVLVKIQCVHSCLGFDEFSSHKRKRLVQKYFDAHSHKAIQEKEQEAQLM